MTTNYVLTINPTPEAIRIRAWTTDDQPLTLEHLQESVQGWIEIVRHHLPGLTRVAVINEEGLLKGLQPNHPATDIVDYPRTLVGPAVICMERGPELFGMTREEALEALDVGLTPGPAAELLDSAIEYGSSK